MDIPNLRIEDYTYDLPPERIAQHPLAERDASKLLCSHGGVIREAHFRNIASCLPPSGMLVFNNTRVIRARLLFRKPSGTQVEIFCLEPLEPVAEVSQAFQQQGAVTWKCLIGNAKRWKSGILEKCVKITGREVAIKAERREEREDGTFAVSLSWMPSELRLDQILEAAGRTPLPPYISRKDEDADLDRYQTIFAIQDGSVAAPTAGLHFTPKVMDAIRERGIRQEQVTLHVGLGTFRPVTAPHLSQHIMHREQIIVKANFIRTLITHYPKPVIAVGTTSVRTLESLYWMGAGLIRNPGSALKEIGQWDPYIQDDRQNIPVPVALQALADLTEQQGTDQLTASTRLLVVPGYRFSIIHGMITNFHQPGSTLLMLIAAFLGERWREIYRYALENGFRFLSYGDSCLFLQNQPE